MNILNWPGWEVTKSQEGKHDMRLHAVCLRTPHACTHCGAGKLLSRIQRHGVKEQEFMDAPVRGKRVGILVRRSRFKCLDCGRTFLQPLEEMHPGHRMTNRLVAYLEEQSLARTFAAVSRDVGLDEKTVRIVFDAHVRRLDTE